MILRELAEMIHALCPDIRYVTLSASDHSQYPVIQGWDRMKEGRYKLRCHTYRTNMKTDDRFQEWAFWWGKYKGINLSPVLIRISSSLHGFNLDLSEYIDADGRVDYSKCFIEIKDKDV